MIIHVFAEATGASGQQDFILGVVTASEQAVAIGATALPDPGSPGGVDWLLWDGGQLMNNHHDGTNFRYAVDLKYDIRSGRKLQENNTDLVLLFDNAGTLSYIVTIVVSTLIRLP